MFIVIGYVAVALLVSLPLCLVVPSVIRMSRRSVAVQRRAAQIMRGRQPLSAQEFGVAFFPPSQAAVATRLRKMLEDGLIVDPTRMRPDDRLDDLGFGQIDGLDPNFLELDVESEFGVALRPAWASIHTFRDLVVYVCDLQEPPSLV
jgi:hypothetical protein